MIKTIEEKAKAYDEAIKKAELLYKVSEPMSACNVILETIFQKLKESDDERIRKSLLEYLHTLPNHYAHSGVCAPEWIAWLEKQGEHSNFISKIQIGDQVTRNEDGVLVNLSQLNRVAKKDEKQGEQKPTDKVKPKFHEGDWIIHHGTENIYQVVVVIDDQYQLKYGDNYTIQNCADVDRCARLWDIAKDAKDGDVLATLDYILIFKKFLKNDGGISYCHYDFGAVNPQFIWFEDKNWYFGKEAIIHPATKEQRDLLFTKMKESGYEWNAEKKELKKIEQKPAEWSEQDEEWLTTVIGDYNFNRTSNNDTITQIKINWLKSLKNRVQPQSQQEWNEEDKKKLNLALYFLNESKQNAPEEFETYGKRLSKKDYEDVINWLKSLRPQNAWKPSDEQMQVLVWCKPLFFEPKSKGILESLINDLKKLKEE